MLYKFSLLQYQLLQLQLCMTLLYNYSQNIWNQISLHHSLHSGSTIQELIDSS